MPGVTHLINNRGGASVIGSGGGGGSTSLAVTFPGGLEYLGLAFNGGYGTVTTAMVTPTIIGGVPPYTAAWTGVSALGTQWADYPSRYYTTFSSLFTGTDHSIYTWTLTVTDAASTVVATDITVTIAATDVIDIVIEDIVPPGGFTP